jgi:serine/threonine protein kinase/WD40 repeat protein
LLDLIEEFTQRLQAGEALDVEAFVLAHADHADALREVLPALQRLGRLGGSAAPGSEAPQIDGLAGGTLGDYRLLRQIGRGGMGIVYEAVQASLGRHVALKVLPAQATAGNALQRFRREAQAAARLHHQHIVPVFGVGQDGPVHYYAMQYINGLGLDVIVRQLRRWRDDKKDQTSDQAQSRTLAEGLLAGRFTGQPKGEGSLRLDSPVSGPEVRYFRSVAALGARVAEALHYAHNQGILHRDIKPSNLLLDTQGVVWVTDFGLARVEGLEDLTGSGDLVGTLRYMAPERFRGQADARSDVYSLGLTLYDLLSWRPAFDENDQARLIQQISHGCPPPPRQWQPSLPRDLETIVLKAIDPEPARRYQTAAALAEDLERFRNDQPIRARPLRVWGRLLKWTRRRPAVATLLAALTISLLALLAVGVAADLNIRQALAEKEEALEETKAAWERVRGERDRAEAAAYQALRGETRALRLAHEPGWRGKALANLRTLLAMKKPPSDLLELREEAVLCLSGCDLQESARLSGKNRWTMFSVDFSPDGATLACLDIHSGLHLWGLHPPHGVRYFPGDPSFARLPSGHRPMVRFRPDGTGLVYVTGKDRLAFVSRAGGRPAVPAALDRKGTVWSFALDGRGQTLAVGWHDGTITGHDAASGTQRWSIPAPKPQPRLFALHPDGNRVVIAGNATLEVHKAGGMERPQVLGRHDGLVALAVSGDGRLLASASEHGLVKLWLIEEARELHTLSGSPSTIARLAFSPEGDLLAAAGMHNGVRLWETNSGRLLQTVTTRQGAAHDVRFSPDGNHLAVAGEEVVLYRVLGHRHCRHFMSKVRMGIFLTFHPRQPLLATAQGPEVVLWDLKRGKPLRDWQVPGGLGIQAFAFAANGRTLATASVPLPGFLAQERTLHFWDPDTRQLRGQATCRASYLFSLAFDDAGQRLVGGATQGLRFVDVSTGKQRSLDLPHLGTAMAVAFQPQDRVVVAPREKDDCRVLLCSASDGRVLHQVYLSGRPPWYFAVAPDGATLAAESTAGRLHLLSLPSLEMIGVPHSTPPGTGRSLAFAGTGLLATAHPVHGLVLWKAPALERLCHLPCPGNLAQVTASPDGKYLALAGRDGVVSVYDVEQIRAGLKELGLDW